MFWKVIEGTLHAKNKRMYFLKNFLQDISDWKVAAIAGSDGCSWPTIWVPKVKFVGFWKSTCCSLFETVIITICINIVFNWISSKRPWLDLCLHRKAFDTKQCKVKNTFKRSVYILLIVWAQTSILSFILLQFPHSINCVIWRGIKFGMKSWILQSE